MGVKILFNLMILEWKKLKRNQILIEVVIYLLIFMFFPMFFIKAAMPEFGQSYALAIELNLHIQMGVILFGGSLISQVFIEEYKNKTISLSFGYPISRKKLFMAKVLFISLSIFLVTLISFILTGLTTYLLDQAFPFINGDPTMSDISTYFTGVITYSLIITLISFVPLFLFGIWKRGTISTVICSIFIMQLPKFSSFLNLETNFILLVLSLLGALSIYLTISTAESIGEI